MSSRAKIAANRANGRKTRGPRTTVGKSKASRNALKHGLAIISRRIPEHFAEIEAVATAICDGATDPLLLEQALIIAENGFVRGCVEAERIATIERHRDPTVTALATGDLGFARANATLARAKLVYETLVDLSSQAGASENAASTVAQSGSRRKRQGSIAKHAAQLRPIVERSEFNALRSAMSDLERLERYRRRAWSQERRAIRRFVEIQCGKRPRSGRRRRRCSFK